MSQNKFVGIAYWTLASASATWLGRAVEVLQPLEDAGLAVVTYDCDAVGDHLVVTFGDERHQMLANEGKGRGVVRASDTAAMFVVCLVALRRALGDLKVVTDSQEDVPPIPRQTDPLFGAAWQRVLPIAQQLGLAVSGKFVERHKSILQNVF